MKFEMSFLLSAIIATSFLGYSEGSLLRSRNHVEQRELWFGGGGAGGDATTSNLGRIIDSFTPLLERFIQTAFTGGSFDEVDVGLHATQILEDLDFADCTADGTLAVDVGKMIGMNSFRVDSVELIPGTESLDISFLGLNGGTWGGSWTVKGVFEDAFTADGMASLVADACGSQIQEESAGAVNAKNPVMEFVLDITGSTPGLMSFGKNQAQSVSVESVQLTFDSVVSNIGDGLSGRRLQLDLGSLLDLDLIIGVITDLISGNFANVIITLVTAALETLLPPIFGGESF